MSALEQGAHLVADPLLHVVNFLFLLVAQREGGSHLRIGESGWAAQLQRDLLEALELVGVEDFGQLFLLALLHLDDLLAALLAT
ncbi:MAG: hypothetical protein AB7O59_15960 [Pirellulales bacterium]